MNHFLTGFADELIKTAAFGQQTVPSDARGGTGVASVMKNSYGAGAKAGLKGAQVPTAPAQRTPAAPSPLTTPSHMIDLASKI